MEACHRNAGQMSNSECQKCQGFVVEGNRDEQYIVGNMDFVGNTDRKGLHEFVFEGVSL